MHPCAHHALACGGGGDRTIRALRNVFHHLCQAAGLRPELEKPGLLRTRPMVGIVEEDGRRRDGPRGADGRWAADVFIPCWRSGRPTALDFVVASGLRVGALTLSAEDVSSAVEAYAARKRAYLDTAARCDETGTAFAPMVVEASGGGWGADTRSSLRDLSRIALLTGDSAACNEQLAQSLFITPHRANGPSPAGLPCHPLASLLCKRR